MLTILTGDKVSSGDALIVYRGMKLLKYFYPTEEILKLERWKPIDDHLEKVNQSRAIILLGGPAFERNLYPGIYPLTTDLNRIKVPILAMGLGSSLIPCNETAIKGFRFASSSRLLLDRLMNDFEWVGIRDYITKRILINNGIHKADVIGCPAWYNLDTLGKAVSPPKIETVAFAPGVRHLYFKSRPSFIQQCEIMKILKGLFPDARKYCVFQDSLENDDHKPYLITKIQRNLAEEAKKFEYQVVDCTYNVDKMLETYERTDLLISYRVHSHICMLSMGKPSVLIAEDSRGYGVNDLIGLKVFSSFIETKGLLDRFYLHGLSARVMRRLYPFKINSSLPSQVKEFLLRELENGFLSYSAVHEVILHYFKKMECFIKSIP